MIFQKFNKLVLFICALSLAVSSCGSSKTDPAPVPTVDARDKFVGTWRNGAIELKFPNGTNTAGSVTMVISKGTASNSQILFAFPGSGSNAIIRANVSGNTYTYEPFTYVATPTQGEVITVNGTGTATSTTLSETLTLSKLSGGTTTAGTGTSSFVK